MPTADLGKILKHSVKVTRKSEGAVDDLGHPAITYTTVFAALSCYFWSQQGTQRRHPVGEEKLGDFILMTHGTVDLTSLDRVEALSGIVGLTLGEVVWAKGIMDLDGLTHHLEAEIRSL